MSLAQKVGQVRAQGRNFCYLLPPTHGSGGPWLHKKRCVVPLSFVLFAAPVAENAGNVIKQAAFSGIFVVV